MAVDDLWFLKTKRGPDDKPLPSKRYGRGRRWRVRIIDPVTKEKREELFTRKTDAENADVTTRADIARGRWIDPRAGKITLREYAGGWESTNVAGEAQTRIVDNALRLHILPVLGDRAVSSIRRSDVQGLVKGLAEVLGPGSVGNVYEVLGRIMAAAVDDEVIAATPCKNITLPPKPEAEVVPPTVDEVRTLAATVPDRYRGAVVLLAGSGLRIGELLGLRVSDVDFLRRTVRVDRQRLQNGRIGPPKTAKSKRTVPLGRVVLDELAAHLAAYPSDEWLFINEGGRPAMYRGWKSMWNTAQVALQRAENEAAKRARRKPVELEKSTTHDLRHFYASALIAGGASVKQVQVVLGHSSAVVTLRVYSHLWPGDEDRTRSIVDSVLGSLSVSPPSADCAQAVPGDLGAALVAG
ncbi:tyrosine-type recombinase/integrase [Crossiella sp. CA198]|uniref:tyrosine-type recombinase/integrase n=1 Tax=Crossiella sp. CA198 TaxID=3455607 RepID=UPI003F8D7B8D